VEDGRFSTNLVLAVSAIGGPKFCRDLRFGGVDTLLSGVLPIKTA